MRKILYRGMALLLCMLLTLTGAALAEDYESKRWRLRQAEYSQRTVDRSYQDMLHWLLGNGFALDEAAEAAEDIASDPLFLKK